MGRAKKNPFRQEFVQVPNKTAQSVEKRTIESLVKKQDERYTDMISLQALGLITNLWSYNVEEWELHKTELYKRYGKNKETSVKTAWKELIDARYIMEFKYRDGKKWEYVYYYNVEPFTQEEINKLWEMETENHGTIWGLDFQDLKMKTSNCRPQNQEISNNTGTEDLINTKLNENKIGENLNPNPSEVDIWETLSNIDFPMTLKQKIKIKIIHHQLSLTNQQLIEIEESYHYQKNNKKTVLPDASPYDVDVLSDFEFSHTVDKMLETVTDIRNMRGLIKSWVEWGIIFKRTMTTYEEDVQQTKEERIQHMRAKGIPIFDWLEEDGSQPVEEELIPFIG